MINLSTLKQQVEEMQDEIERLEAEERELVIPVGTLCWFWDNDDEKRHLGVFSKMLTDVLGPYVFRAAKLGWKHARIASDIPGCMIWQKHDGGPCPVDEDVFVVAAYAAGACNALRADNVSWEAITAYAIINKAEWME